MLGLEKAVYLRVGRCAGIAECISISKDGILLALTNEVISKGISRMRLKLVGLRKQD